MCTQIVDGVRGELTSLQRATLGALVVMDVHARDVVTKMAEDGVSDLSDFGWQAQLRTYWEANEVWEVELGLLIHSWAKYSLCHLDTCNSLSLLLCRTLPHLPERSASSCA